MNTKEITSGFTDEPTWLIGEAESSDSQIWIEGKSLQSDVNILVTVTSANGEQSAYASKQGVVAISA